jgi:hypothetical protein
MTHNGVARASKKLHREKKRAQRAVRFFLPINIGKLPAKVKTDVIPETRFSITQSRNTAKSVLEIY